MRCSRYHQENGSSLVRGSVFAEPVPYHEATSPSIWIETDSDPP
jgi:hypothetical protein